MVKDKNETSPVAGEAQTQAKINAGLKTKAAASKETETPIAEAELSEKLKARAAAIFKSNPSYKRIFVTSDGFFFSSSADAKRHSATLKDKAVGLVSR